MLAPDLTTRGATLALETPDGPVKGELHGAGASMSLRLVRGSEAREVRVEQPSNLFLPQPFFAGFARTCPLLEAGTPALVEFPGSPLTVVDHQPVPGEGAGAVMYTVERGPLGRTVVVCDKGDFVAALDPWSGQSAARVGKKAVLDAVVLATTRQKPKTPDGLVEEDVLVTVPALGKDVEAKLACSFMKPATALPTAPGKKAVAAPRLPAVVFFSGSGPQDRDEDTIGPGGVKLSVFKTMAIALGEKGVASLRCDDRGTGQSTGVFEQATLPTFVRDAEEVVKALRLRADVNPAKVGVVGHSEGAVVAPVLVRADGKIKAVLLMAAPGRPIPDIAVVQQQRMLEAAGLPKDQVDKQMDAQAEVLKAIRHGDPLPVTVPQSERARIEGQRAWLKSHFDHDPQKALREMPKTAVLVVQGAKDLQVPAEDADSGPQGARERQEPRRAGHRLPEAEPRLRREPRRIRERVLRPADSGRPDVPQRCGHVLPAGVRGEVGPARADDAPGFARLADSRPRSAPAPCSRFAARIAGAAVGTAFATGSCVAGKRPWRLGRAARESDVRAVVTESVGLTAVAVCTWATVV